MTDTNTSPSARYFRSQKAARRARTLMVTQERKGMTREQIAAFHHVPLTTVTYHINAWKRHRKGGSLSGKPTRSATRIPAKRPAAVRSVAKDTASHIDVAAASILAFMLNCDVTTDQMRRFRATLDALVS